MPLRSQELLHKLDGAFARALLKCMEYTDSDIKKPLIVIANSWNTLCPGHFNLRQVSEHVKKGIQEAGGTALEFGVIGACDGLAQMHEGMRYILPTRELIANNIEAMVKAHPIDAIVMLGSCDKIVPGMLIAAVRLDITAILVNGGPMLSNKYEKWNAYGGDKIDTASIMEAVELVRTGKMSEADFKDLIDAAAAGPGSCQYLGTANSMCCLAEALGLVLPGTAMIPAVDKERLRTGYLAGKAIMHLLEQGITAKQIINKQSMENAIMVMSAIGGSTNIVLHSLALAYEAQIEFDIDDIGELSAKTPQIASIMPASKYDATDFHLAGSVPAVMKELKGLLNSQCMTVSGKSVSENITDAKITNPDIIKTIDNPFAKEGGLIVLYGNLAPEGAVTKAAAIEKDMLFFEGPAKVFDGESETIKGIRGGKIAAGDVIVIRYEGPKGGPGMPEMWAPLKLLAGAGLLSKVAVITDGRFSGSNSGLGVGYISPEAQEAGPLAALKDGDLITIDVNKRKLSADIGQERLKSIKARPVRQYTGYLGLYSKIVSSASKGAIINPENISILPT